MERATNFTNLKKGDVVMRVLGGTACKMQLKITEITDKLIICGPWTFSKTTGAEIDAELGWTETRTGSYLEIPDPADCQSFAE